MSYKSLLQMANHVKISDLGIADFGDLLLVLSIPLKPGISHHNRESYITK